jgi:hypothetical protein
MGRSAAREGLQPTGTPRKLIRPTALTQIGFRRYIGGSPAHGVPALRRRSRVVSVLILLTLSWHSGQSLAAHYHRFAKRPASLGAVRAVPASPTTSTAHRAPAGLPRARKSRRTGLRAGAHQACHATWRVAFDASPARQLPLDDRLARRLPAGCVSIPLAEPAAFKYRSRAPPG